MDSVWTCGCWPSRGIVCVAHAPYATSRPDVRPYCCPVCGGKGRVPVGFYDAIGVDSWMSATTAPESCRACDGSGLLWR